MGDGPEIKLSDAFITALIRVLNKEAAAYILIGLFFGIMATIALKFAGEGKDTAPLVWIAVIDLICATICGLRAFWSQNKS